MSHHQKRRTAKKYKPLRGSSPKLFQASRHLRRTSPQTKRDQYLSFGHLTSYNFVKRMVGTRSGILMVRMVLVHVCPSGAIANSNLATSCASKDMISSSARRAPIHIRAPKLKGDESKRWSRSDFSSSCFRASTASGKKRSGKKRSGSSTTRGSFCRGSHTIQILVPAGIL